MAIHNKILNVVVWVVIFHTQVVGFCILLAHHGDSTTGPLLNEQMQLQLHYYLF